MRLLRWGTVAAVSTLWFGFAALSEAVPGQTPAQPTTPSPASKPNSAHRKCANVGLDAEQIRQMLRNMQGEQKLAGLSQRLAKEEAMSSPEIAKLQDLSARLEGKEGRLEAEAQAMSARAREVAAQMGNELEESRSFLASPEEDAGWLGVEIEEVTPQKTKALKLSAARGVIVEQVEPDGPAAKAGLKTNDVILEYDGQTVEGTIQFRRLVRETPPGRTVNLEISRGGATQTLSVQVANRNAYYEKRMRGAMPEFGKSFSFEVPNFELQMPGPGAFLWMNGGGPTLGIEAEDLSGQLGAYFGAPNDRGVLVRSVRAGTPAQAAGLRAGDVIIKLDGSPVESLSGLREQLRAKREQKSITLGLLRKQAEVHVTVRLEHPHPEFPQAIHTAVL